LQVVKHLVLYSIFIFFTQFAFSQQWKDSLQAARKLYKSGDYVQSYQKYKSAQKNAPKNIDLSDEMGQSAYKAQEFEKAEKLFKQSSSAKGDKMQKAKAYHNIGNSKLKQKKYEEAIDAYKESLRNNPNDEETRYNLAEAMKKQKNQQDKKNQEENKDNKDKQENKNQEPNKDKQENKQQNSNQNQSKSNSSESKKSQLSDKKTERMLDDLAKKEMETKKKMGGNKSKSSNSKSGKDW
jgi:Ca-activated chloride channel family protein